MSKPEDIPQDAWDAGAKMAGEYFAWLNAGNSLGNLSEHAVAAMADTIARAILAAKAEERSDCLEAVRNEQLSGDSDDEGDRAYMRAINDAAAAIRKRGEG